MSNIFFKLPVVVAFSYKIITSLVWDSKRGKERQRDEEREEREKRESVEKEFNSFIQQSNKHE